ncbi:MAG: hypothetical protein HYT90_00540 [Candidatus Omnitrophica bacterium]|nr:hypothetical protein [Candidatus Omnitrophota bacterium]
MTLLAVATAVVWVLVLLEVVSAIRRPGPVRTLKRLLAAAVFAALGTLLGSLLILLQLFHAFAGETLIARVTTVRRSPAAFELRYAPASGEALARTVQLEGDQWAVSGGIVKWHPWLAALGVKSYHKPMRIGGQFSQIAKQRARPPTVYPIEPEADRFWEALYWADPHLPFVEAVYGSSAYAYVEPGVVQEVYVTPSGYLIKRAAR